MFIEQFIFCRYAQIQNHRPGIRQTKTDHIHHTIRDALGLKDPDNAIPPAETLQRAFRLFVRQSEVDYFLCKDAKSFLREQFDFWMWQYILGSPGKESQTSWTEIRFQHLQILKRIAYHVIDCIAAFEDELVNIWNKPKFVLNSHFEEIRTLAVAYDVLYWYSKDKTTRYRSFLKEASHQQRTHGRWTAFAKGEAYDRPTMRYELLGVGLQAGQWKWKKSRAEKAVQNYLAYRTTTACR